MLFKSCYSQKMKNGFFYKLSYPGFLIKLIILHESSHKKTSTLIEKCVITCIIVNQLYVLDLIIIVCVLFCKKAAWPSGLRRYCS